MLLAVAQKWGRRMIDSPKQLDRRNEEFENATPQEILSWARATYAEQLAIVTSFQLTGIVTLHMMHDIAPDTRVLTLDTGFLFPETVEFMNKLEERFQLRLKRIKPRQTPRQQARDYGDRLWERNPDRCCHIRKTIPLRQALDGFAAWITGLRRDQSPSRASTAIFSRDARTGLIKIAPFANWSEKMVWTYIRTHDLPYNRLHDIGYPSIGCWTCTKAVTSDANSRAGRWSNRSKSECGIHIPDATEPVKETGHV